jgi:DNA-binding NarL/FixJ family response regulator
MPESVLGCLIFTTDGEATASTLSLLLGEQGACVTRCADGDKCLDLLGRRHWRFVVIDASRDMHKPLDVLSQARRTRPDIPALVLVKKGDTETAVLAMKAGAAYCVETPVEPGPLRSALGVVCGEGARELQVNLSRAERIVLRYILDGRTNRQIADVLCRSRRTVEVHRRHIMVKLRATSLIELMKQAIRAGMVDGVGHDPRGEGPARTRNSAC